MTEVEAMERQGKSWDPCGIIALNSPAIVIVLNQPIENERLFKAVTRNGVPYSSRLWQVTESHSTLPDSC